MNMPTIYGSLYHDYEDFPLEIDVTHDVSVKKRSFDILDKKVLHILSIYEFLTRRCIEIAIFGFENRKDIGKRLHYLCQKGLLSRYVRQPLPGEGAGICIYALTGMEESNRAEEGILRGWTVLKKASLGQFLVSVKKSYGKHVKIVKTDDSFCEAILEKNVSIGKTYRKCICYIFRDPNSPSFCQFSKKLIAYYEKANQNRKSGQSIFFLLLVEDIGHIEIMAEKFLKDSNVPDSHILYITDTFSLEKYPLSHMFIYQIDDNGEKTMQAVSL